MQSMTLASAVCSPDLSQGAAPKGAGCGCSLQWWPQRPLIRAGGGGGLLTVRGGRGPLVAGAMPPRGPRACVALGARWAGPGGRPARAEGTAPLPWRGQFKSAWLCEGMDAGCDRSTGAFVASGESSGEARLVSSLLSRCYHDSRLDAIHSCGESSGEARLGVNEERWGFGRPSDLNPPHACWASTRSLFAADASSFPRRVARLASRCRLGSIAARRRRHAVGLRWHRRASLDTQTWERRGGGGGPRRARVTVMRMRARQSITDWCEHACLAVTDSTYCICV